MSQAVRCLEAMVVRRLSLLVGLAAIALVAIPASGAGSSTSQRLASVEPQIVREINRVRVDQGLRPLTVSPALRASAVGHTSAMLDGGFFDHTSLDGTSAGDRIGRLYPMRPNRRWSVGETLFATSGELTPRETVTRWLTSPAHRQILLAPQWRDIGIGVARSPLAGGAFGNLPASVATADFGVH